MRAINDAGASPWTDFASSIVLFLPAAPLSLTARADGALVRERERGVCVCVCERERDSERERERERERRERYRQREWKSERQRVKEGFSLEQAPHQMTAWADPKLQNVKPFQSSNGGLQMFR